MSHAFSPPPSTKEFAIVASVVAVLLLGAAGGLASGNAGGDRGISTMQDEGEVTITSPVENETFAHADIIRIDLEFENAETAVLTLENTTVAGPEPVTFHVTVHDADGSGNATVYFNPFQAFDGPVTDCGTGVPFEDCTDFVVPGDHRDHGFFTHPDDDGSALLETGRPAVVRYAPAEDEPVEESSGTYVVPAEVSYDLSVSAGIEVDHRHNRYPGDSARFRLEAVRDCTLDLLVAPRTGPNGIDPGGLESYGDVRALLERDIIRPPRDGQYVEDDEYLVFDLQASGIEGIFHEVARQVGQEGALLDGEPLTREAIRHLATTNDGAMGAFRLDVDPPSLQSAGIGPAVSIEQVVSRTDDRGHRDRYAIVLSADVDSMPAAGNAGPSTNELWSGSVRVSTYSLNRGPALIDLSGEPVLSLFCRPDEVEWTFFDVDNQWSISAGFTHPNSPQGAGENVTFNGLRSEGVIGSYEWEFGDGTSATGRSVKHAFDEPGEYTVELTVSGPAGNDTATETVIVVEDADDPYPPASFTVDQPETGPETGKELTFDAVAAGERARVEGYRWDFGDGTTATGSAVTHTYDEPGEYTVALTVRGIAGENTTRRTVVVEEASEPSVSITGESQEGAVVLRADVDGGGVERYGWDMGDGTALDGETVTHTYDEPGEYTVTLFVTGPGGTDTASVTVTVEEADEAAEGDGSTDEGITVPLDEEASGQAATDDGSGPGLGVLAALAALVGVAGLLRQHRRRR